MSDDRQPTAGRPRYTAAGLPLSAFLHVVCIRCGLIVDRKRKSTDLRTPTELFERVQCGNCRARSVLGEVIFSFDGGVSFYQPPAPRTLHAKPDGATFETETIPQPNWPPWQPRRYVEPTLRASVVPPSRDAWSEPLSDNATAIPPTIFDRLRNIAWDEVALYTVAGVVGLVILEGLRTAVYVYAVALGG